jgi:hypothetical protein
LCPVCAPPQGRGAAPEKVCQDELLGENFTVHFYFADGHSAQVTLHYAGNSLNADSTYSNLVMNLRAKYGRELISKSSSLVMHRTAAWLHGRTNIGLWLHTIEEFALLNIVYQVRLAQDADKL